MRLNELADNQGANKKRTRVGRGPGSGKGKITEPTSVLNLCAISLVSSRCCF